MISLLEGKFVENIRTRHPGSQSGLMTGSWGLAPAYVYGILGWFFSGCSGTVMAPLTFFGVYNDICLVRRVINPFITVKGHNCGLCFASSFASSFRAPDGKVILWCRLQGENGSIFKFPERNTDWLDIFRVNHPIPKWISILRSQRPSVFVAFLQFNP